MQNFGRMRFFPALCRLSALTCQPFGHCASIVSRTAGRCLAAHLVAADPVFNQVYVPIPSTAGGTLCSGDAQGCIAVFTAAHDDQETAQR
jgi:hypothetical protein